MAVQSEAHFGVRGRSVDELVRDVREALQGFEASSYGIAEISVEGHGGGSFSIFLHVGGDDVEKADVDLDRAMDAIANIINTHFSLGTIRERQREVTLI